MLLMVSAALALLPYLARFVSGVTIPTTFDAFVPTNAPDVPPVANFTAQYVPFAELEPLFAKADQKFNASHAYVTQVNTPAIHNHNIRIIYYAYALLNTGWPSASPDMPQISSAELLDRVYITAMLHDVGLTKDEEALQHLAHTTSFEIFGGFLAYDHLKAVAYPDVGAPIIGDVIQSINLHTLLFNAGNSTSAAQLLHLCAFLDVGGWDIFGKGFFDGFWHNQTINEIERAYPRLNFRKEFGDVIEDINAHMPNTLWSHDVPPLGPNSVVDTLIREA